MMFFEQPAVTIFSTSMSLNIRAEGDVCSYNCRITLSTASCSKNTSDFPFVIKWFQCSLPHAKKKIPPSNESFSHGAYCYVKFKSRVRPAIK